MEFKNIVEARTGELKLHPLQQKIYGAESVDPALVESITKLGILTPLLIDGGNQILSGTRRWQAAQHLGVTLVPVTVFGGTPLEAEQILVEANRQREKTVGQKARETAALFHIERELAAQREKAGTLSPDGAQGQTREIVARKTGQSKNTVEKLLAIVSGADRGDEAAQRALESLDQNGSVAGAYRMATGKEKHQHSVETELLPLPTVPEHGFELEHGTIWAGRGRDRTVWIMPLTYIGYPGQSEAEKEEMRVYHGDSVFVHTAITFFTDEDLKIYQDLLRNTSLDSLCVTKNELQRWVTKYLEDTLPLYYLGEPVKKEDYAYDCGPYIEKQASEFEFDDEDRRIEKQASEYDTYIKKLNSEYDDDAYIAKRASEFADFIESHVVYSRGTPIRDHYVLHQLEAQGAGNLKELTWFRLWKQETQQQVRPPWGNGNMMFALGPGPSAA